MPVTAPGQRARMHSGLAPPDGSSASRYFSAFYTVDGRRYSPDPGVKDVPVVFLVNAHSDLPAVALALQAAGKANIVVEGSVTDAPAVGTRRIELTDGLEIALLVAELIYEDGSSGLRPDLVVPQSRSAAQDRALEAALELARHPKSAPVAGRPIPAHAVPPPDRTYPEMRYPPLEYRLLAAFRIWSVFHYFFPYKDLMGEDWDGVLKQFIPRMEQARNALEYHLAVAEMVTHVHDTHASVWSETLEEHFGAAPPPIRVRMIEGEPVITGIVDAEAARASGIQIGDVIVQADGEDAKARLDRYGKYTVASTPQSLQKSVAQRFLNGPGGTTLELVVRGDDRRTREAKLPRKSEYLDKLRNQRATEMLQLLPGNIGYADLDRLPVPMVDAMFEKFRDTKAIIFDMRGYPLGTAWAIAPRLTDKVSVPAARYRRPLVMSPAALRGGRSSEGAGIPFADHLPQNDKWKYRGRTVMLIDERTFSQAEHTGLFFEAANGTKFIGSPTAGANGDISRFYVPGDIQINLSAQEVRHADGRQLQRVGLIPDVEVKPPIRGIRSGRDEVLEKALEYVGVRGAALSGVGEAR